MYLSNTDSFKNQGTLIGNSKQLFQALKKNPDTIPREAYPWMVYAMESKDYDVC